MVKNHGTPAVTGHPVDHEPYQPPTPETQSHEVLPPYDFLTLEVEAAASADRRARRERRRIRKLQKMASSQSVDDPTPAPGSTATINSESGDTKSFTERMKRISQENPPTENPIGFSVSILAGICCATTALGVGICIIVLIFFFLQLIPVAAIIIGGINADSSKHCPAENIPLLLILGGVFQMCQVLLSEVMTVRALRRKFSKIAFHAQETEQGGDESIPIATSSSPVTSSTSSPATLASRTPAKSKTKKAVSKIKSAFRLSPQSTRSRIASVELVEVVPEVNNKPRKEHDFECYFHIANMILGLVNLSWFIAASVLVFRLKGRLNKGPDYLCDEGLYNFAFWYLICFYIVIIIVLIGVALFLCAGPLFRCLLKRWERNVNLNGN